MSSSKIKEILVEAGLSGEAAASASTQIIEASVSFSRIIADAYLDAKGLNSIRPEDAAIAADLLAMQVDKILSDAGVASDGMGITFVKYLADTVTTGETMARVVNQDTTIDDDATAVDAAAIALQKALTESLTVSDSIGLEPIKGLSDSLTAVDASRFVISRADFDPVTASEAIQSFQVVKGEADSVSTADAGAILVNDYIDPSYFQADYVGAKYTF